VDARTGWPSLSLVTLSNKLRAGVLSRVPASLEVPVSTALVIAGLFALGSSFCSTSTTSSLSDSLSLSASASTPLFLAELLSDKYANGLPSLEAVCAASALAVKTERNKLLLLLVGLLLANALILTGAAEAGVAAALFAAASNMDLAPDTGFWTLAG